MAFSLRSWDYYHTYTFKLVPCYLKYLYSSFPLRTQYAKDMLSFCCRKNNIVLTWMPWLSSKLKIRACYILVEQIIAIYHYCKNDISKEFSKSVSMVTYKVGYGHNQLRKWILSNSIKVIIDLESLYKKKTSVKLHITQNKCSLSVYPIQNNKYNKTASYLNIPQN